METKARMVFLGGALALTLVSGWRAASASPIYENHFDVYRTITATEAAGDRSAKPRHAHIAKHRPASTPVVLSGSQTDKLNPGTRVRSQ